MVFNSLEFVGLLIVTILATLAAPSSIRWLVLSIASVLFYAALGALYLLAILLVVSFLSYCFGLIISKVTQPRTRKVTFWLSTFGLIAILVWCKYLPFLGESINTLCNWSGLNFAVAVPEPLVTIGMSYFIFQALSYLFDLYVTSLSPERHFGYLFLYLGFFPKILQGPIERGEHLLPQLRTVSVTYEGLRAGLVIFAWGLFKKVVIADRLSVFADAVYGQPHEFSGISLLLATYAYAFQLYCDFSGYTDMAIGVARMFGITLSPNFNRPYLANSVIEFWRRWHMTFSRWILDYIFKPLQIKWRHAASLGVAGALIVTFLVSGIWHGAGWSFVCWGLLHGAYMATSVFWQPVRKKLLSGWSGSRLMVWGYGRVFVTFNLICLGWVLFRSSSLSDAWYVVTHMFSASGWGLHILSSKESIRHYLLLGQGFDDALLASLVVCIFAVVSWTRSRSGFDTLDSYLEDKPLIIRWSIYYAVILAIIFIGDYQTSEFLYMRF